MIHKFWNLIHIRSYLQRYRDVSFKKVKDFYLLDYNYIMIDHLCEDLLMYSCNKEFYSGGEKQKFFIIETRLLISLLSTQLFVYPYPCWFSYLKNNPSKRNSI